MNGVQQTTKQAPLEKNSLTGQAGRFIVVGILNTFIDYLILNLLVFFGFTAILVILGQKFLIANIISVFAAMINSFILNKQWTFQSKGGNVYLEIVKFFVITVIGMFVVHQLVFNLFYYRLPAITASVILISEIFKLNNIFSGQFIALNFAKTVAVAVSLIWNFLGYKFIVFKPRGATAIETT